MSIPRAYILVFNIILQGKRPEIPKEVADFRATSGLYKINLKHLVVSERKKVFKKKNQTNTHEQTPHTIKKMWYLILVIILARILCIIIYIILATK